MASPRTMPSLLRRAVVASALALVLAAGFVGCPGLNECPCVTCPDQRSVELTVVEEETGAPIDDFVVEVVQDGDALGEPFGCGEGFRDGNTCSFGDGPGIYLVIVSAPGYETREAAARVAAEAESELCCRACLAAKQLTVELTPLPFEG